MKQAVIIVLTVLLLVACAETKYVPEGRYMLDNVKVEVEDGHYRDLDVTLMKSYVRQLNSCR